MRRDGRNWKARGGASSKAETASTRRGSAGRAGPLAVLTGFGVRLGATVVGHAGDSLLSDMQSAVTTFAILAGGVFAFLKFRLFRDFEPHLTVSQEVSHRSVGDSYVHILVVSTLHNSSRVLVELREGLFRLQQVHPIAGRRTRTSRCTGICNSQEHRDLQWPTLDESRREWAREREQASSRASRIRRCEFIAPDVHR